MNEDQQYLASTFEKSRIIDADIDYGELIELMEIDDEDSFGIVMEKCEYSVNELGLSLDERALESLCSIIFSNIDWLVNSSHEAIDRFFETYLHEDAPDELTPQSTFASGSDSESLEKRAASQKLMDIFGT